jgi:hypothetical protein
MSGNRRSRPPGPGPSDPADGQRAGRLAAVHSLAVAMQGGVLALLAGSAPGEALALLGAFAAGGVVLARVWQRWASIPHAVDMAFGMLTLGNLGMLAGWWADRGFTPVSGAPGCPCGCSAGLVGGAALGSKVWMVAGMVALGNLAMAGMGRRGTADRPGRVARALGGNVGGLCGMVGGGFAAALGGAAGLSALLVAYLAMAVGMGGGMSVGHALTGRLLRLLVGRGAGRLRPPGFLVRPERALFREGPEGFHR